MRSILRGGSGQDREANGLGQVITLVHVYWIKGTSNQRKDVHKRYMVAERLLELSELLFFPESGFNARRFKSDLPDVWDTDSVERQEFPRTQTMKCAKSDRRNLHAAPAPLDSRA